MTENLKKIRDCLVLMQGYIAEATDKDSWITPEECLEPGSRAIELLDSLPTFEEPNDEVIYQAAKRYSVNMEPFGESTGRGFTAGVKWMQKKFNGPIGLTFEEELRARWPSEEEFREWLEMFSDNAPNTKIEAGANFSTVPWPSQVSHWLRERLGKEGG